MAKTIIGVSAPITITRTEDRPSKPNDATEQARALDELLHANATMAALGERCLSDLSALFTAIGRMTPDHLIQSLVCSATYLAEDWQRLMAEEAQAAVLRHAELMAERGGL